MINISEELKQDYLQDSIPKQLHIITEQDAPTKLSGINWYTGQYNEWEEGSSSPSYITNVHTQGEEGNTHVIMNLVMPSTVFMKYINDSKYIYLSCIMEFENVVTAPAKMGLNVAVTSSGILSQHDYMEDIDTWAINNYERLFCRIDNPEIINSMNYLYLTIYGPSEFTGRIHSFQIESSNELYDSLDFYQRLPDTGVFPYLGKSLISKGVDISEMVHVHQPDIMDIGNTNLDSEAFSLYECLSSKNNLKFGACESSYCQFTVKDRTENWKDRYIRPYVVTRQGQFNWSDINWYKGGAGFTPQSVQTYSYAHSNLSWWMYTDEGRLAPELSSQYFNEHGKVLGVKMKIKFTLSNYTTFPYMIRLYVRFKYNNGESEGAFGGGTYMTFTTEQITSGFVEAIDMIPFKTVSGTSYVYPNMVSLSRLQYKFYDEDGHDYTSDAGWFDYTVEIKDLQICLFEDLSTSNFKPYSLDDCVEYQGYTIDEYIIQKTSNIPLGRFKVTQVEEQYDRSVRTLNVTAYDELYKLEENAADWYSMYMYLVSFTTSTGSQKSRNAFTRQIFSSYWNMITQTGIDSRDKHDEVEIYSGTASEGTADADAYTGPSSYKYRYRYITLDVSEYTNKVFVADIDMDAFIDDFTTVNAYKRDIDANGRGWVNAQILVEETLDNGDKNRFCADSGDYFKLHDNCSSIKIWYPYDHFNITLSYSLKVSHVDYVFDLENAATRLVYFNYGNLDIFACDSNITIRDVIRSLLEVTGCFFTMDRYGVPQFKYCIKGGLYPSNNLYPADNLYPRGASSAELKPMHYIKSRCADYTVQNFGKIQIVKNIRSNKAESIVEWEYIGDPTSTNAYLIDDNIFYCNDAMTYDYDSMTEVSEMLRNLFSRISNLGYVPNVVDCVGLPWVETGDRISIYTTTGGYESFIFERNLKGIQALKDEFESKGDEYTKAINNYSYKEYKT